MVVAMRGLTSLSASGATPTGLQERPDASLVRTSSAEQLNAASSGAGLSPAGFGEGRPNPGRGPGGPNRLRVPVADTRGVPLRWRRRQLHRLEPEKGGVGRRYGGTLSLGLKGGTLVKHIKHGLCYLGGSVENRFSLHSLKTGRRITQNAKREDFKILARISFRTQFISTAKVGSFLGWIL